MPRGRTPLRDYIVTNRVKMRVQQAYNAAQHLNRELLNDFIHNKEEFDTKIWAMIGAIGAITYYGEHATARAICCSVNQSIKLAKPLSTANVYNILYRVGCNVSHLVKRITANKPLHFQLTERAVRIWRRVFE